MSPYNDLTDEQKLEASIRFVATSQPLPQALVMFLHEQGLYEAITEPEVSHHVTINGSPAATD